LARQPIPVATERISSDHKVEIFASLKPALYSGEVSSTEGRSSASGSSIEFSCSLKSNLLAVIAEVAMLDHWVVAGCDFGNSVCWLFFTEAVHCFGTAKKKRFPELHSALAGWPIFRIPKCQQLVPISLTGR
jgi:hypothetical protein